MNIKKILTSIVLSLLLTINIANFAYADSVSVNFENPPYTTGVINGQDGWVSLGAAGSGCTTPYDHEVDSSLSTTGFGSQSLRISNAVTSGCFGDMTYAKPLTDSVGEADSTNGTFTAGTKQAHFEMQFDIASTTPNSQQTGLFVSVSPDRGDGSRMSYVGFSDDPTGITINFFDVQGTTNPANFVSTNLGTYSRTAAHTIKLAMDVVDGPSNDIVKVYVDGVLKHTGTSWENYYRFDSESSAEQSPRIVKTAIFRTGGTAAPTTSGNGFLFDNLSLSSGPIPSVNPFTVPAECNQNIVYNKIEGTAASERINGTNGNDLILAKGGSDSVDGKAGDDCIVGGNGSDSLKGGAGADVILGGEGADSIEGNSEADKLYGEDGGDSIDGGSEDDTLSGGAAADSLRGGGGNDTLAGDGGSDLASGQGGTDTCTAEAKVSCEL